MPNTQGIKKKKKRKLWSNSFHPGFTLESPVELYKIVMFGPHPHLYTPTHNEIRIPQVRPRYQ